MINLVCQGRYDKYDPKKVQTFGKNGVQVKANKDGAKSLGEAAAAKLQEQGLSSVVFDRNVYPYTGRVKILADSIRENGITL